MLSLTPADMLRIFYHTTYDFIRPWRIMVLTTAAFISLGLVLLGVSWLRTGTSVHYSIDFTGGTLVQVQFQQPPDVGAIRSALDAGGVHDAEIQSFGTNRDYTIRAQDVAQSVSRGAAAEAQAPSAEQVAARIDTLLTNKLGTGVFRIVRTEAVGPRVGSELRHGAVIAILVSFVITLLYLAIRFEWRFGVAAVIATAHDILTTLAFIKLLNLEVSLTVVAAILTVIGYSLNDTIIIFDRVREDLRKKRKESLYDTLNRAINETLPRSVMTHATAFAATLALLLLAGEVIRPFAWVMAFGIVTGTFSSVYVAGPVLLWIERRWPRDASDRRSINAKASKAPDAPRSATQAASVRS
jgi:preprotein translocase subunit SecF